MKKLAVVSGGTKGIGRAVNMKFAANGFDVVSCARNQDDLNSVKKDIESTYGVSFTGIRADMSTRKGVDSFAKLIMEMNRPIDILVNNAGYFQPGLVTEEDDGVLEKMIDTNLYSAYNLTRALVSKMKEQKKGHIFNICSVASLFAYPNGGSYSISKFALLGFSKVLREELKGYGIKVTSVIAGATFTDSWAKSQLPEERFMKVEDIADAIYAAYALSPQSVVEELILRPQLGDI